LRKRENYRAALTASMPRRCGIRRANLTALMGDAGIVRIA